MLIQENFLLNLTLDSPPLHLTCRAQPRSGKNLGILVAGDSDNGVEPLVASSSGQNFYAGTLRGQDSLWDVSSQVAKWQLAVSSGPLIMLVLGEGDDVCINLKAALHNIKSKNVDDVFY